MSPRSDFSPRSDGSSLPEASTRRRRPRADAQRNRESLLTAARDAFRAGADPETVSLEAIARDAGVGIGTLYRNFPTRQDLAAAVYRSQLDDVVASAGTLLRTGEPAAAAFRAWADRYAAFVATKRGMADTLRRLMSSGEVARTDTRAQIRGTVEKFLHAGAADGSLRADVQADDVVSTLLGVFLATADTTDRDQTDRILDLLLDGLRPR